MRFAFLIAFLVAASAFAHDFWIEPSTFRLHVGTNVLAGLRVGQEFVGDPVARDSSMIERFIIRDSAGERVVPGLEKRDPAGVVAVEQPGLAIIGYRAVRSFLRCRLRI